MSRYVIVQAERRHLFMVAARLRTDDRLELEAMGGDPRRILLSLWSNSTNCWAAFVDGDIALVGGCEGMLASSLGRPWLFTTPAIEKVPLAFAKEAKRWLREVLETKSALVSACLSGYEKSARFWSMLGFQVGEPFEIQGGAMFRHLVMER